MEKYDYNKKNCRLSWAALLNDKQVDEKGPSPLFTEIDF